MIIDFFFIDKLQEILNFSVNSLIIEDSNDTDRYFFQQDVTNLSPFDAEHVRNRFLVSENFKLINNLVNFSIFLEIRCDDYELQSTDDEKFFNFFEADDVAFM